MSHKYHKIPNIFKREEKPPKNIILNRWFNPELEALSGTPIWYVTEKIDGTNVRVIWDGNRVEFRGKTDNAQMPPRLLKRLEELFGGPENEGIFEQEFGETPVTLYGEGFGSKIQTGGDYFPNAHEGQNEFALFDININGVWLERSDIEGLAENLQCESIPFFYPNTTLIDIAREVLRGVETNTIPKSRWGQKKEIEGYVARTNPELRDKHGNRVITKIKYDDFKKVQER